MSGKPEGQGEETEKGKPPKPRPVIVRIFRALKRYENRRRRRRNSQHQLNERMMARWTRHVGLFTGALVVVGIVTAVIFWRQLNVMRGQLDAMRDEFTATNRPWVSLDSVPKISTPLFFLDSGDISFSLQYSVTNSGRTPAIYVVPMSIVAFTKQHNVFDIIKKTIDYCEEKRIELETKEGSGILVPPGKSMMYPTNWSLTITKADIEQFKEDVSGRDAIIPYIGGCMNYQFTFGGKKRHQTGFIYHLVGPDTSIFLDGGNIAVEKLHLLEQAGAWAD